MFADGVGMHLRASRDAEKMGLDADHRRTVTVSLPVSLTGAADSERRQLEVQVDCLSSSAFA